jgi:hypothetical protein
MGLIEQASRERRKNRGSGRIGQDWASQAPQPRHESLRAQEPAASIISALEQVADTPPRPYRIAGKEALHSGTKVGTRGNAVKRFARADRRLVPTLCVGTPLCDALRRLATLLPASTKHRKPAILNQSDRRGLPATTGPGCNGCPSPHYAEGRATAGSRNRGICGANGPQSPIANGSNSIFVFSMIAFSFCFSTAADSV